MPRFTLSPLNVARCALAAGALILVTPASAAPQDAEDAVARLLSHRGLLDINVALEPQAQPLPSNTSFASKLRDTASDMVMSAMGFLGVPYRRGGDSAEAGFDCSGFTRHIFERSLGLVLPRRVDDQARAPGLLAIGREELKPGDLVFFNTLKRTFSHVGIYLGEGKFIHAPRTGGEVRVEDMRFAYWAKRFTGARRPQESDAAATANAAALQAHLLETPAAAAAKLPARPVKQRKTQRAEAP